MCINSIMCAACAVRCCAVLVRRILLTAMSGSRTGQGDPERDAWDMECCYHQGSGTLFLDIVPGPPATYKDADKLTYYGYHFETACTGELNFTPSFVVRPASLVTDCIGHVMHVARDESNAIGGAVEHACTHRAALQQIWQGIVDLLGCCCPCCCLPCVGSPVLRAGGGVVDATSEFGIVVTYRLGRLQLLMAAEIDAQQPGGQHGPAGGAPYVEMKTYTYVSAASIGHAIWRQEAVQLTKRVPAYAVSCFM